MIRAISSVRGLAIGATDGSIGSVSDFLFDDATWLVRWIVIDTGNWLAGRKVLLPPGVFEHFNHGDRQISVSLSKQQVTDSPSIDTDEPVSRALETHLYDYYGWSPYWSTGMSEGGYGFTGGPMMPPTDAAARKRGEQPHTPGDPHLRSVRAVTGYHIAARDGDIGYVEDFLVEDTDWSIHYVIVETSNWWFGNRVMVSPLSILEIDWLKRRVALKLKRDEIKSAPTYDADVVIDGAYEDELHRHYGTVAIAGPG